MVHPEAQLHRLDVACAIGQLEGQPRGGGGGVADGHRARGGAPARIQQRAQRLEGLGDLHGARRVDHTEPVPVAVSAVGCIHRPARHQRAAVGQGHRRLVRMVAGGRGGQDVLHIAVGQVRVGLQHQRRHARHHRRRRRRTVHLRGVVAGAVDGRQVAVQRVLAVGVLVAALGAAGHVGGDDGRVVGARHQARCVLRLQPVFATEGRHPQCRTGGRVRRTHSIGAHCTHGDHVEQVVAWIAAGRHTAGVAVLGIGGADVLGLAVRGVVEVVAGRLHVDAAAATARARQCLLV